MEGTVGLVPHLVHGVEPELAVEMLDDRLDDARPLVPVAWRRLRPGRSVRKPLRRRIRGKPARHRVERDDDLRATSASIPQEIVERVFGKLLSQIAGVLRCGQHLPCERHPIRAAVLRYCEHLRGDRIYQLWNVPDATAVAIDGRNAAPRRVSSDIDRHRGRFGESGRRERQQYRARCRRK